MNWELLNTLENIPFLCSPCPDWWDLGCFFWKRILCAIQTNLSKQRMCKVPIRFKESGVMSMFLILFWVMALLNHSWPVSASCDNLLAVGLLMGMDHGYFSAVSLTAGCCWWCSEHTLPGVKFSGQELCFQMSIWVQYRIPACFLCTNKCS